MAETFKTEPNGIVRVKDTETLAPVLTNGRPDDDKRDYLEIEANGHATAGAITVSAKNDNKTDLSLALEPKGSGTLTLGAQCLSTTGNGAAAGTGVSAVEEGAGGIHKTILTLDSAEVDLTDEANTTGYGSLKVYNMPAGAILFLGAVSDLDVVGSGGSLSATFDGDVGLGTTAAGNDAAPLATTEQNIIPNTATPQAVDLATTANAQSTATENAVVDGTSTAVDVYLNFLVDDIDQGGTGQKLTCSGTITIVWVNLGDY
jgi:hypothetical protein